MRLPDFESIRHYAGRFPVNARQAGNVYFNRGAVLSVDSDSSLQHFVAKVEGTRVYQVDLEFNEKTGWLGYCTCPVTIACKHIFAAAMAIAEMLEKSSPAKTPKLPPNVIALPVLHPVPNERPAPPPAPESPLQAALEASLSRRLKSEERRLIQAVQELFRSSRHHRQVNIYSLRNIAPEFPGHGWDTVELWPNSPADDLECWLHCAYEMQRRKIPIPSFMQPITNLELIDGRMREWRQKQNIEHWRTTLQQLGSTDAAETEPVSFRCAAAPDRLQIQWKRAFERDFRNLKQTHSRDFFNQHRDNSLNVDPASEVLWSELYRLGYYDRALNLSYKQPEAGRILQRLISTQHTDSIVTHNGNPIAIPDQPLRYEMHFAESENDDYQLKLVQPDGSPAPLVLCVIPGSTTYYLTTDALWKGPRWHALPDQTLQIPAQALESEHGLSFLNWIGVETPPRLKARTRIVQPTVKITAEIKRTYPSSETEEVRLKLSARFGPGEQEQLTPEGWIKFKSEETPSKESEIRLFDRTLLGRINAPNNAFNARWEPYEGFWRVRLTKTFPEAFTNWLESLPPDVEVLLDKQLATLRNEPVSGSVRLDVQEAGIDWFDLKVVLDVTDTTLTQEEINLLLNARGGYVRLGKKGWRRLKFNLNEAEEETLSHLGLTAREFTAEPQRLHALQLADKAAKKLLPAEQVAKIQRRASEIATRVTPEIPSQIQAQLRPYQLEGFHFLAYLTANSFGGVLADDMGLGKTVQTLTWLQWLQNTAGKSSKAAKSNPLPSLVVCPKSVMDNWHGEAARFCPSLRVRLWKGEPAAELAAARASADLIVLNYPQLRLLSPQIAEHSWLAVILDEAQSIKNPESQTAQSARALRTQHRIALTGTPIENRLLDLWSIMAFAMPGVLGNRAYFTRSFNQQDDPFARRRLSARVRPFVLRRTKNQVAKDLPDRVEEDLLCEMEPEQLALYKAEFKRAQQMLLKVKTQKQLNEQRFNFLTSLLRLRQICCHPGLVSTDLAKAESAKLNALMDLIEPLMEEGHKVLVFSQFVSMLDLIQAAINERGWAQFFLAGDTENRGDLVREFQGTPGAAVFLISLKAGGFGLNLTAASYVVLFDPWWNPAVESQAIDRTHRIGQTSKVIAYRLLIKDSIEQKIRVMQRTKAALAEDVLGEEKFSQSLTLDDLKFLFEGE